MSISNISAPAYFPLKMPANVFPSQAPIVPGMPVPLSAYSTSGVVPQSALDQWTLQQALKVLGNIRNLPGDEAYLYSLGINPVFHTGAEALQVIQSHSIRVEFGDMGESPAHAQWVADQNLIMINQRYRGDTSPDTLCAISEAIYHEAGHAKGDDDQSSIQEELDCLALNTMAHRFHESVNPLYAQNVSQSPLIANGVALYAKLFFDPDPRKAALIKRVIEKYGDLPLSSPDHPVPWIQYGVPLAMAVQAQKNQGLISSVGSLNQPLKQPVPMVPIAPNALLPLKIQNPVLPPPSIVPSMVSSGQNLAAMA